jgi:hypothetical protein
MTHSCWTNELPRNIFSHFIFRLNFFIQIIFPGRYKKLKIYRKKKPKNRFSSGEKTCYRFRRNKSLIVTVLAVGDGLTFDLQRAEQFGRISKNAFNLDHWVYMSANC